MRRFDYCFLLDLSHPSNLIGRAIGIAALKERGPYRMKKNPLVFRKLEALRRIVWASGFSEVGPVEEILGPFVSQECDMFRVSGSAEKPYIKVLHLSDQW